MRKSTYTKNFQKLINLLRAKEGRIALLEDSLKIKEEEILLLKATLKLRSNSSKTEDLLDMKEVIQGKQDYQEKHIVESKKIIIEQNRAINEFRGSVVYPLYRFTTSLGRTRFGKLLESLFKRKQKGYP